MTVKEGKHGLEGVSDDGRVVSEVPSKEAIERDKKIIKELEDEIQDNINRTSQAAVAIREGGVKDEAGTRQYIEQLHEERKELRERVARVKARAEGYERALTRKANVEKIDKIIGTEKIKQGADKKADDANYKKLQSDISKIKKILSTEKSRENFGQEEVRKLRDKYSDYMSGNWTVVERFRRAVDDFDDWASNYENNSYRSKMNREIYNALIERIESLEKTINGGKGSGNFGHAGREGKVGGSASTGSGGGTKKTGSAVDVAIDAEYGDTIRVIKANPKTPNVEKEFIFQGIDENWGERGFLTGATETSDASFIPFSWIEKAELIKKTSKKG